MVVKESLYPLLHLRHLYLNRLQYRPERGLDLRFARPECHRGHGAEGGVNGGAIDLDAETLIFDRELTPAQVSGIVAVAGHHQAAALDVADVLAGRAGARAPIHPRTSSFSSATSASRSGLATKDSISSAAPATSPPPCPRSPPGTRGPSGPAGTRSRPPAGR